MAAESIETDEAVVSRVAAGDQDALSLLYDRHRTLLMALALRILRDRSEAEEILGDVFFQAWRQAGAYDRGRASVEGWLINLCRSRAIDRLRSRGRREVLASALARDAIARPADGAANPMVQAAHQERRRFIVGALAELGEPQREALELAYYGGLSHSEIAEKLAEPLGTVKTRIRQGLIALRESLGRRFAS